MRVRERERKGDHSVETSFENISTNQNLREQELKTDA